MRVETLFRSDALSESAGCGLSCSWKSGALVEPSDEAERNEGFFLSPGERTKVRAKQSC